MKTLTVNTPALADTLTTWAQANPAFAIYAMAIAFGVFLYKIN